MGASATSLDHSFTVSATEHSEQQQLESIFRDFGLSTAETAVFSTLLRLGSKQAGAIAKHSGINRAYVYSLLEKLLERGLISVHDRNGIRIFTAMPLEHLIQRLAEQELALSARRVLLEELLPRFRSPKREFWSDPATRTERGAEVCAQVGRDLANSQAEGAVLFCAARRSVLFDEIETTESALKQILELAHVQIVLCSSDTEALAAGTRLSHPRLRTLASDLPVECLISGATVKIFGRDAESCKAILLEQAAFAETLRCLAAELFRAPTVEETNEY